jgi:VanZ family protein
LCGVSKVRSFAKYWLPVLIWMAVIFSASGDRQSFRHSSRIIAPIVRWLFPQISDESLDAVVTFVRKGAHVAEYAVLAALCWRALRKPRKLDPRSWSWRDAGWAVSLVALYALTDEIHQSFVPSRYGSWRDVLVDTMGGVLGLLLVWAWGCWRRCRRQTPLTTPSAAG